MKSWIPFLALCLFVLSSCTKSEVTAPVEEDVKLCDTNEEATVQRMVVNEDGTEFFYYLELNGSTTSDVMLFPKNLSVKYQVEGMKVQVEFGKLPTLHSYIVCLEGHQIDPANPDVRYMSMVEVCSVEEAKF